MSDPVWFEPLRLTDAATLRLHGISLNDAQSLTAIRDEIRDLSEKCGHQLWLTGISSPEKAACAVVGLQMADANARRAILHLFAAVAAPLSDILKSLIERVFWQNGIYRLEISIPASCTDRANIFRQIGFVDEGRQRCSLIDLTTRRRQDLFLLSLLRPEYESRGTAFIPFRLGVFAVTGNRQGLFEAGFVRYGEPFPDSYQHECAEMAGILDDHGHLQERQFFVDRLENQSVVVPISAPEPVSMAAAQVQAYFAGQLSTFDLPLDLSRGSDFQTRVWQALARIPYGTTWTYEELAFQLNEEDWPAARRMARAVGSACGANPLPLLLPCHRVIGKDRRLVGFSGGLDVKEFLLDHEMMYCGGGNR